MANPAPLSFKTRGGGGGAGGGRIQGPGPATPPVTHAPMVDVPWVILVIRNPLALCYISHVSGSEHPAKFHCLGKNFVWNLSPLVQQAAHLTAF